MGPHPSLTYILALGGITVLLNIAVPASNALGRGLGARIDQLLGTPPEIAPPAPAEED